MRVHRGSRLPDVEVKGFFGHAAPNSWKLNRLRLWTIACALVSYKFKFIKLGRPQLVKIN